MRKDYLFMKFDFDKYNTGKLYVVKEAREKFVWDSVRKKETDEYEGVQLLLEVRQDDYVHETNKGKLTEVSLGDEFSVLIRGANLEDYEDLVMRGFDTPKPVEITKYDDVRFYSGFQGKPSNLKIMDGDVREYKKETPSESVSE